MLAIDVTLTIAGLETDWTVEARTSLDPGVWILDSFRGFDEEDCEVVITPDDPRWQEACLAFFGAGYACYLDELYQDQHG